MRGVGLRFHTPSALGRLDWQLSAPSETPSLVHRKLDTDQPSPVCFYVTTLKPMLELSFDSASTYEFVTQPQIYTEIK